MAAPPNESLHSFNFYPDASLKADIADISAKLGISQRLFVELAVRAFVTKLHQSNGYIFPPADPRILLRQLLTTGRS